jgi:hypothetical protein
MIRLYRQQKFEESLAKCWPGPDRRSSRLSNHCHVTGKYRRNNVGLSSTLNPLEGGHSPIPTGFNYRYPMTPTNSPRKDAYTLLLKSLASLRKAADEFLLSCTDPRLVQPFKAVASPKFTDPFPITFLHIELENLMAEELPDIEICLNQGVARLKQIRNDSGRLVPIHRLPNELISTIFLLGTEPASQFAPFPPRVVDRQQYHAEIVSHVCHLWRVVSLRTESLWTNIDCRRLRSPDQMSRWLERSGNSGISVSISFVSVSDSGKQDECLSLVIEHFPFWKSLKLAGFKPVHLSRLTPLFQHFCSQTMLRSIELFMYMDGAAVMSSSTLYLFLETCADKFEGLSSLSVPRLSLPEHLRLPPALSRNLTTLRLQDGIWAANKVRPILRDSTGLRNLFLVGTLTGTNDDIQPISLPTLIHFSLDDPQMASLPYLLDLQLDKIERYTFTFYFSRPNAVLRIVEFLSRPNSAAPRSINLIDLHEEETLPMHMLESFRYFPNIEELNVKYGTRSSVRDVTGQWSVPLHWAEMDRL